MSRIVVCGLLLSVLGCRASAPDRTVFNAVPYGIAIPPFNVDSVTHDSTSALRYALVGTVVDSASRQPISAAQVLLKPTSGGRDFYGLSDSHGGFVVRRVPPGRYALVVRRLGYAAVTGTRVAKAGVVDTVRFRMRAMAIELGS
jgi:hypothetical protein